MEKNYSYQADAGQICVDGEDIVPLSDYQLIRVRMKFGMLFQYAALFDSLTVEENVMFPLLEHRRRQLTRARMREIVRDKLQALGLFNVERSTRRSYRAVMRKRVGLARAIVLEPEVPEATNWEAFEYLSLTADLVSLFCFRCESPDDSYRAVLKGLQATASYRVSSHSGGDLGVFSGAQLMREGLVCTLPGRRNAEVFILERL